MDENNSSDFQFIKETIKERPLNKKKLFLRLFLVVISALIFGLISAGTFVLVIRNVLPKPEETPAVVNIPRDEESDSISEPNLAEDEKDGTDETEETAVSADEVVEEPVVPADEVAEEPVVPAEEAEEEPEKDPYGDYPQISYKIEHVSLTIDDYKSLYRTLKEVANETGRSIVTVTAVTSDMDWFENLYENSDSSAGLIVANNGKDLLILTGIPENEANVDLSVTFCDGEICAGSLKSSDRDTGLAIISVPLEEIPEDTVRKIKEAELGNSRGTNIVGLPVMALGSPLGIQGSQCFGRTISNQREMSMVDKNIHILSTDIYGSENATGVITNYDGQIMGIISQNTSMEDAPNLLTAYSISDLKGLIEKLSNNSSEAYLGIYGTDVTKAINEENGVPLGLYITKVALDSPALNAGIQSGDVITRLGTAEISSYRDYMEQMMKYQPGDEAVITVQRYSKGEFQEMTFEVTIDDAEKHIDKD